MNSQGTFALTQISEQQNKLPNIFTTKLPTLPTKKGGITTLASSSLQTARHQGPAIPQIKLPQAKRSFSVRNKREVSERLFKTKREEDSGEIGNLVKQIESEVNLQVDSMYRMLSPKDLENKLKQIEASYQSKEILGQLVKYMLKTKNVYNDLVYQKKIYYNQQKFLKEQIANLKVASLDSEFLKKRIKNLDEKHDEILQMIENEKFQTEILIYMRTRRKMESMNLQKPIAKLRKQLQVKSRQIVEIGQQAYRKIVQLKSHEIECQQVINETHLIRDKREGVINQDLQTYKQRCILMKIFQKEQEKDFETQCYLLDLLKSVDEDNKRKNVQEEEMLDKELLKNDEYLQRQERLFQQIKQVTSVNSIQDMLPHLKYLEHTKLSLQEAAENTKQLIADKQKLLQDLLSQKQELLFLTNDMKETTAPELLDNKLFQKDKHLFDAEKKLNYFNKLLASSNAVINKMGCQLADQETECKPENLSQYLSELGMKLETMMQAIDKKKIAPLDQSINRLVFSIQMIAIIQLKKKKILSPKINLPRQIHKKMKRARYCKRLKVKERSKQLSRDIIIIKMQNRPPFAILNCPQSCPQDHLSKMYKLIQKETKEQSQLPYISPLRNSQQGLSCSQELSYKKQIQENTERLNILKDLKSETMIQSSIPRQSNYDLATNQLSDIVKSQGSYDQYNRL